MRTFEHGARLFDMHCHLGFVNDAETVRRALDGTDAHALSCTVLPEEYERDREAFAGLEACTVALGLHPWQVASGAAGETELARFEELAPTTRFIGEVGLDYAGSRGEFPACEAQQQVFHQVLIACNLPSDFPRKLLSIHAVHAASNVLDMLEEHDAFARHDCIFHWFAGTSEELKRAIDAGCFFSVGPRMLATKRGREYARIIPIERLLLETDSPSAPGEAWSREAWLDALAGALATIANIRNISEEELARTLARTSETLLTRA